nr:hypothetical protein CFP56_21572 [Quercus suber]
MLDIQNLWAEDFHEVHGRDIGGLVASSSFTPEDLRRTLPEPDGPLLPPRHRHKMLNQMTFLSTGDITALHSEYAAESLPPDASPLPVSDAINALLWQGIMQARAASAEVRSSCLDEITVSESPVDFRD